MKNNRIIALDFVKALAIVVVIIIHVLSRNLGPDSINSLWNYLHFVVPMFVFCSGYLVYRKFHNAQWTTKDVFRWYGNRTVRLLLPYYIFLGVHYLLWFLFPTVVSGYGLSWSPKFIRSSLMLTGVDYGWLPILFLELMVLTPLYIRAWRMRPLRYVLIGISALSTIGIYGVRNIVDYRLTMWLPWSFVFFLSFESARWTLLEKGFRSWKPILVSAVGFLAIFFLSTSLFTARISPPTLALHKYPPDFYYLSYGLGIGSIVLLLMPFLKKLPKGMAFVSTHSYSLFFVHYLSIDVIETIRKGYAMPVWEQLAAVIFLSLCSIYLVSRKKMGSLLHG